MKAAHKYRLIVKFNNKPEWDLMILSINTEAISLFIPREETDETHVIQVKISLIERNAETVKDTFLAKCLN